MVVYTREKIKQLIKIDFIRFSIVGGVGFVINFIILVFLRHVFGVPLIVAQFIGAEIALFNNFLLHDNWTYKDKKVKKSFKTLLIQFHATAWPAIIGSSIMVWASEKFLNLNNFIALALASGIAFMWNFFWSKFVIWRDVTAQEVEETVK